MSDVGLGPLLMKLAHRECGVASDDPALIAFSTAQVGQRANRLVADGHLFKAKFSHRSVRWFGSLTRAAQAERNNEVTKKAGLFGKPFIESRRHMPGAARQDGDMIITEKTIFTQCPGHTPRFQEMAVVARGGNQRGRVLQEDVELALAGSRS